MPPRRANRSQKRSAQDDSDEDVSSTTKKSRTNCTKSVFCESDFTCDMKSPKNKPWNLKISSWNVSGLRALIDKGGFDFLKYEKPDIFCVQETKCSEDKLPKEAKIEGYKSYWSRCDTAGYSGVGLYTRNEPIDVTYGIGVDIHDKEGRVITAEYEAFYLVVAYVPNAGRKLVRLDNRMDWDKTFKTYLTDLDKKKPVILCGDLNVAHKEIDLANPKTNKRNAGFTQEERDGLTALLNCGFVDSFRHIYPDIKGSYTFWTYMGNARSKNVGWRLDYFLMSERFAENLCEHSIRSNVYGSDHCPITLFLGL